MPYLTSHACEALQAGLPFHKMVISSSAWVHAIRDDHGRTALHWAAVYGLESMAIKLLEAGAKQAAAVAAAVAAVADPSTDASVSAPGLLAEMQV